MIVQVLVCFGVVRLGKVSIGDAWLGKLTDENFNLGYVRLG
jgi:hypothetical protein